MAPPTSTSCGLTPTTAPHSGRPMPAGWPTSRSISNRLHPHPSGRGTGHVGRARKRPVRAGGRPHRRRASPAELTHPDEDYPTRGSRASRGQAEMAGPRRRAGGPGRPRSDRSRPHAAFEPPSRGRMVDVENLLCDLRSQKSPAELDVIRYAYKIAESGSTPVSRR